MLPTLFDRFPPGLSQKEWSFSREDSSFSSEESSFYIEESSFSSEESSFIIYKNAPTVPLTQAELQRLRRPLIVAPRVRGQYATPNTPSPCRRVHIRPAVEAFAAGKFTLLVRTSAVK